MKKYSYILVVFILFPLISIAQANISGLVKDRNSNAPLENVHISFGNQVAITNAKGEFTFENIKAESALLIASIIGYKLEQQRVQLIEGSNIILFFLEQDDHFIDEVIVSATRTESRISDIPGRVEVITPEKISLSSYQSVDELLSLLPGVQTARSFGLFSFRSTVSMRGVSGKEQARTLVLLNGVPVNKA
ncbi:MAG: hypothetical protein CVT98_05960, partial [Bacteroidetes bacterium HGW-Bacteroidetes-15]